MMSHKQHTPKWLPLLLIALVAVLIRKIVGLITPQVALDDGQIVVDTNSPKEGVVQAPGEKIIPEPQPPQVPIAEVADAQSIPEVPSDIVGVVSTIQGRPTGSWTIDALPKAQQGEIVFFSGQIITEGEIVLGGVLMWGLEDTTKHGCTFTIASYTEGHLVGWLKWGDISRKVDLPMHITFAERMIVLDSIFALPYAPWDVLKQAPSQSEFLTLKWTITLVKNI